MAAQFVFILQRVHDRAKLESYWARAGATFAGHSVKLLAGYSPVEVIEGQGPVLATVIATLLDKTGALQSLTHGSLSTLAFISRSSNMIGIAA